MKKLWCLISLAFLSIVLSNNAYSQIDDWLDYSLDFYDNFIPEKLRTDAFLKEFQETFFPDAPMEYVKKFVVEGLDKEYYFYNDDKLGGRAIPLSNNGILTGNSNVYFNDGYVFESPKTYIIPWDMN